MDVHPPKNGINRYWSIPIYQHGFSWYWTDIYIIFFTTLSNMFKRYFNFNGVHPWKWENDITNTHVNDEVSPFAIGDCTIIGETIGEKFGICHGFSNIGWFSHVFVDQPMYFTHVQPISQWSCHHLPPYKKKTRRISCHPWWQGLSRKVVPQASRHSCYQNSTNCWGFIWLYSRDIDIVTMCY